MNVLAIVLICTAMNHMGLVKAVEDRLGIYLPILNCVKCGSFWGVLVYLLVTWRRPIGAMAISFLCSYASLWLEIGMGYVDKLYLKCYEKIVSTADTDKASADSYESSSADSLS